VDDETYSLGEHIELSGFKIIDHASMIIVRKLVGNYTRKFIDNVSGFSKLKITLKEVHNTDKSVKYELHGNAIINTQVESTEATDRNLFYALDTVLKKLEAILIK
jgi:hypothetical protein